MLDAKREERCANEKRWEKVVVNERKKSKTCCGHFFFYFNSFLHSTDMTGKIGQIFIKTNHQSVSDWVYLRHQYSFISKQ